MSGQTLLYSSRNLTRIPDIPVKTIIDKLDLSNNKIIDFSGIKNYQKLKQIILDSNPKFASFRGIENFIMPELNEENNITLTNSLMNFSCQRTPLGNSPNIALMATIVFGNALKYVNGTTVSSSTYKLASSLRNETFDLLVNGWIITSTNPIRILNVDSRKRKIIYPQTKSNNLSPQKKKERKNSSPDVSSGPINVYLEHDSVSSKSESQEQTLDSPEPQNKSPRKTRRRSPRKGHKKVQDPEQELRHKEEEEEKEREEREREEKERAEKEQKESEEKDKELRQRFNDIHDEFLNGIGPIFNNNNEYIVYNATPNSPSQSRLGRTRSQAANYSPNRSPRNGTSSQAENYSSNQSPRDRSRSQTANYSPSKTNNNNKKSNSPEKITTGTPMKKLIRERKKRNVSVKKESPYPRTDYFAVKRAQMQRQSAMQNYEDEFYENLEEEEEEIHEDYLETNDEIQNDEQLENNNELENHEEENNEEIENQEGLENNDEIENHVELQNDDEVENHADLENNDEIENYADLENNDDVENHADLENNDEIENHADLENNDEIENHADLENNDELENHLELENNEDLENNEKFENNENLDENENLGEKDNLNDIGSIEALLNEDNDDNNVNFNNDEDDDEMINKFLNENENASGSGNSNI